MKTDEYYYILELMQEGYVLLNVSCSRTILAYDYRVVRVNPAFERMTGLSANNVVGKFFSDFGTVFEGICKDCLDKVFRTGKSNSCEIYSNVFDKQFKITFFTPTSSQVACIFRDSTGLAKAEKVLCGAKNAFKKDEKSRASFLSVLSHELRTPLNGIMGALNLLEESFLNEDQCKIIKVALSSAGRLNCFASSLINYLMFETGAVSLHTEVFDLRQKLGNLEKYFQVTFKLKDIQFVLSVDRSVPEEIVGDYRWVQKIIEPLVSNAFTYSKEGIVKLDVAMMNMNDHDCRLLFSVADNGIGIPEESFERIFTPFMQVKNGLDRPYEGAGLGLSICKKIVEIMKGNIAIESTVNKGTTVYVSIPFQLSRDQIDDFFPMASTPLISRKVQML